MHERFDQRTIETIKHCYERGDYDNCLGLFCLHDKEKKLKVVNYKKLMNDKLRDMAVFCKRSRPDISLAPNAKEKLADYVRRGGSEGEPYWISNTRIMLRDIEGKLAQGKLIRVQDRGNSWHFDSRKAASRHLIQQCQKTRRIDRGSREY